MFILLITPQTASTGLRRIQGRSKWTIGRWLTKSRRASLCTVPRNFPLTYKAWRRGTRDILNCLSMLSHGSTPSITIRLVALTLPASPLMIYGLTSEISTELTPPSIINKLRGNLKLRRPALTKVVVLQAWKRWKIWLPIPPYLLWAPVYLFLLALLWFIMQGLSKRIFEKTQH